MQVGHRRTHDQVGVGITIGKPVHDVFHERRYLLGWRTDVRGRSAIRASDLGTPPAVLTGLLVLLEVAGIEVEIEHDTIHPPEHGIIGHDADVVHRPRVARVVATLATGHRPQAEITGTVPDSVLEAGGLR